MLKTMRESFHKLKWTLFAVIIVFILGFVFWTGAGPDDPGRGPQFVARVGGDEISALEFDRQYKARLDQYREQYRGQLSPEMLRYLDLPRQVLDGMINRRLQLEEAKRLKLSVSNDEVAQAVKGVPAFQENGQFIGSEKYQQLLQRYGYTAERFEEEIREDILASKYGEFVRASILVPDDEVAREFATRNDKATIEYVLIPPSRLESGVQPTDAERKAYYEKHRERYRKPKQRRLKYLLVDRARVRAKITPSDAILRADYERRPDRFRLPEQVTAAHVLVQVDPAAGPEGELGARTKAETILARARAGEDFEKLAREDSDDAATKEKGGQLPPFSAGQMVPEFEQAALALSPGELAGPVKTSYGYHVIKLVAKSPARVQTFDEVRQSLLSEFAEKQTEAETDRLGRELLEKVRGLSRPSDEELRKLQSDVVTYNTTEWVSRGDPIAGIGPNPRFSEAAFTTKPETVFPEIVSTARGPAIVKPAEERPEGVPPLAEINARVTEEWKAERREKEAIEKLQPAAQELAAGATLAQIAARYDTEVKTTPEFPPGGPVPEIGNAPELSEAVFRTPQGQAGSPVGTPAGFVLFRVIDRKTGDPKAMEAQKADLIESVRAREGEKLLRASLQQLRAEKEIEINEEALKSFLPEERGAGG